MARAAYHFLMLGIFSMSGRCGEPLFVFSQHIFKRIEYCLELPWGARYKVAL
jgi:hypothetical protein